MISRLNGFPDSEYDRTLVKIMELSMPYRHFRAFNYDTNPAYIHACDTEALSESCDCKPHGHMGLAGQLASVRVQTSTRLDVLKFAKL